MITAEVKLTGLSESGIRKSSYDEESKAVRKITDKKNHGEWQLLKNAKEKSISYTLILKTEQRTEVLQDFTDETMEAYAFLLLMSDGHVCPEHLCELWEDWKDMRPLHG